MSSVHPTKPAASAKPAKPYADFPLFPHATRRWAKKIRGRLHYFGPWDDPDGALAKYVGQRDDLHAGRRPREAPEALTVKSLCNQFLAAKAASRDAGEITSRTWDDYKKTCDLLVSHFGKARLVADLNPDDFASLRKSAASRLGPVALRNTIQRVRSVFKLAFDNLLIDTPVRFGQSFKRPSKKVLRLERARKGPKMFEAGEIKRMLEPASVHLRAMILLGVNGGLGNSDCGTLPLSALDLERGWLNYHREKTGIDRRIPLWPETVQALKDSLADRPDPKSPEHAGLAFVTKYGLPWAKAVADSPITKEIRKLLDALGIGGSRNFYALRHTFETIGGEAKDQVAVDAIMGHARDDMASAYRERISDERLRSVVNHVRAWLFGA